MPSRILREGILSSERVAVLGWAEEVFYRRLMSVVDDFGRFNANPKLILAACYPLHLDDSEDRGNLEVATLPDIARWLAAVEKAGLVIVYAAPDGKRYLELLDFRQQVRSKTSKYPSREEAAGTAGDTQMLSTRAASVHLGGGGGGGGGVFGDVFEGGGGAEPARVPVDNPPPMDNPASGQAVATGPVVAKALRTAGIQGANASHATLRMLLAAGATVEEFVDAAPKAKGKGRPFEYLLGIVRSQREQAAKGKNGVHRGPLRVAVPWQDTQSGVRAKGIEIGEGDWDQYAFEHGARGAETFMAYEARVKAAAKAKPKRRSAKNQEEHAA